MSLPTARSPKKNVPWTKTKKKQNYCKLEKIEKIKENDSGYHTTTKGIESEGSFALMDGWNTTWLGLSDITPSLEIFKPHEYVVSHNNFILAKEIFHYIMMHEH